MCRCAGFNRLFVSTTRWEHLGQLASWRADPRLRGVWLSVTDLPDIHALNAGVVREFRASGGKLGGQLEEFTILLLTTTGAKSGLPRLSPMSYFMIDDKMFIIGSFAGVD